MTNEKIKSGLELQKKIEELKISIKNLNYGCSESVAERIMVIEFNGLNGGIIEMDKKYFKSLCQTMLSFCLNDLNILEKEFEEL